MQIYTALLVFNRSKIVFTTFLSIQILEQFYHKLYFIPRLFIFLRFPHTYNFLKRHTHIKFYFCEKQFSEIRKKMREIQTRKQMAPNASSFLKKNCRLEKIADVLVHRLFSKNTMNFASDGTGNRNSRFGYPQLPWKNGLKAC